MRVLGLVLGLLQALVLAPESLRRRLLEPVLVLVLGSALAHRHHPRHRPLEP